MFLRNKKKGVYLQNASIVQYVTQVVYCQCFVWIWHILN